LLAKSCIIIIQTLLRKCVILLEKGKVSHSKPRMPLEEQIDEIHVPLKGSIDELGWMQEMFNIVVGASAEILQARE
jgi:hypothetical protein